ncbi:MAG: GDSL-type esterase/lipase family protein [Polyangiaceae bacterium]
MSGPSRSHPGAGSDPATPGASSGPAPPEAHRGRAGEPSGLRSPAAAVVATLALLVAVPYALGVRLPRLRLLHPLAEGLSLVAAPAPVASVGETQLVIETKEQEELRQPEEPPPATRTAASAAAPEVLERPPKPLEDPSGHALDAFFARLRAAEEGKPGVARISYWGDSIVASDFVTATLRRKLQRRFGDGGHGFMLVANAWPGYFHNDVTRFATPGWQVSRVVGPFAKDGLYGFGGVSFRSEGPGLFARFATARSGTFGRAVSRFVVDYLEHPGGGKLEVKIDGAVREVVETQGEATRSALRTYDVPDGEHELEIRPLGAGVRAFGVWMERERGVVLDAVGIQGARIRFLDQTDDVHWAEQLALRDPALTIFHYGMNESEDGEKYPLDEYQASMKVVLEQVRRALPRASCLLVGPMDRADKKGEVYSSRPVIPKLAAIQRRVAAEVGCAYWDTYGAMGGQGSMGVWVQRGLGGKDLAHPSSAGAELLGSWIHAALIDGYEAWKRTAPAAPDAGP